MSKISVNVEFMVGSDLTECLVEAKEKVKLWDVAYVCFKFNGVSVSVNANSDVEAGYHKVMQAMKKPMKFVVV